MILELERLSKAFGSVKVADSIDLAVPAGSALGIIGPNGAGKTSLFNLISGALRPDGGTIRLDGRDITRASTRARARAGIARSYQIPQPFVSLSVFENLLVAAIFAGRRREAEINRDCGDILADTGLLALATAPRLLLLDEIAGGLTEAETHLLVETVRRIKAAGVTIVWIEHIVHALIAVVDRLLVLDFGRKIVEGEPRSVMASTEVREIYLGIEA